MKIQARYKAAGQKPGTRFFLAKKNEDSADLYIYDVIGEDWGGGLKASAVVEALEAARGVATLNIFINSPGGDVFEGAAIYNALKRFKARKIVQVDGLAASIASVIAMAGDEIRTSANALWMIHNASGWLFAQGEWQELEAAAARAVNALKKINEVMTDTYARRTKQSTEAIAAIMDAETWLTAQEAKDKGFTDSVIEECDCACEDCAAGRCEDCTDDCQECQDSGCVGCQEGKDMRAAAHSKLLVAAFSPMLRRFHNLPDQLASWPRAVAPAAGKPSPAAARPASAPPAVAAQVRATTDAQLRDRMARMEQTLHQRGIRACPAPRAGQPAK